MSTEPLVTRPAGGPPPTAAADEGELDLDTRIGLAEQRLIAREHRLTNQLQQLRRRAGQTAEHSARWVKLGGWAVAGAALVWLLRRRRGNRGLARPSRAARPTGGGAPQMLLTLLPMVWPLLPLRWRWRDRVSPATVATVWGIAAPVIQDLLARFHHGRDADGDAPPATYSV